MVKLRVLKVAVNCVKLGVNLEGHTGARIYRSRRASGPCEEVGLAFEETYTDAVYLEPGKTYFYRAVAWRGPSLYPSLIGGRPVSARVPRASKERRGVLTRKHQEFSVNMDGYLDESNTVTVGPEIYCPGPNASMPPYEQAFEPNLYVTYVTIENLGETDVKNPWVVVNGQRDWWSVETMIREIASIAGGGQIRDNDKMMAIWKFVVDELYDSRIGMSWYDGTSDPVKLFNVYGFEGCVANAITSRRLAEAMGLKAREIWLGGTLDGHGRGAQLWARYFRGILGWRVAFSGYGFDGVFSQAGQCDRGWLGGSRLGHRPVAPVASKPGAVRTGFAGKGVLRHTIPGGTVCVSAEQGLCLGG